MSPFLASGGVAVLVQSLVVIDGMASTYEPLPSDDVTPEQLDPPPKRVSRQCIGFVAIFSLSLCFVAYKIGQWSVIRPSVLTPTVATTDIPKPISSGMATDTTVHGKYSVG